MRFAYALIAGVSLAQQAPRMNMYRNITAGYNFTEAKERAQETTERVG